MENVTQEFSDNVTNTIKRRLKFSFYESTPLTTTKSRKRKSLGRHFEAKRSQRKLGNVLEKSPETPTYRSLTSDTTTGSYDSCFNDSFIEESLRSTTSLRDNSLQNSNCELSFSFDHMRVSSPILRYSQLEVKSNSSLETFISFEQNSRAKRFKFDSDHKFSSKQKSNSAPGTPQHPGADSDGYIKKCHSLDFSTPTKSCGGGGGAGGGSGCKKKIGTPERNEILYPQLVVVRPAAKPKSPQKLRNELKRLGAKPAKRRLYICRDFVYLFTRLYNNREIVAKVFGYLADGDLGSVLKVSRLWRAALLEDGAAHRRYREYARRITMSKENICRGPLRLTDRTAGAQLLAAGRADRCPGSPPPSPARGRWHKFSKLAAHLPRNQQLTKCPLCRDPAILEKRIAQCTKQTCQYLWCVGCLSDSKLGPDHFACRCEKGSSPARQDDRPSQHLHDISNSFMTNDSRSALYAGSGDTSSGYFSQSDADRSQGAAAAAAKKSTVLTDLNKSGGERHGKRPDDTQSQRFSSFHSVALQCMRTSLHRRASFEPSSPPKVKLEIVGSKQSKKNLRRLCL